MYLNRTMCDVLEEMRRCHKTHNYAGLLGMVEELQAMANRMESALGDIKDIESVKKEWHAWKDKEKEMQESKERGRVRSRRKTDQIIDLDEDWGTWGR